MKNIVPTSNVQYYINNSIYGNTDKPYFVEQNIKHCKNNEIIYIPIVCMQTLIKCKCNDVKQHAYTKKEIIDYIKSEYYLTEKEIFDYNLIEKFLFVGCGEDIGYISLNTIDYHKTNYEFRTIESLDDNELWQLRKQVCLNSLYYSDYYNNFIICSHKAINFFDWYVDFLCNKENWDMFKLNENCTITKDIDTDKNFLRIIDCYDNKDNLVLFRDNYYIAE